MFNIYFKATDKVFAISHNENIVELLGLHTQFLPYFINYLPYCGKPQCYVVIVYDICYYLIVGILCLISIFKL